MPRLTGRGFALVGLAAGTYVAGRVVGTWELYLVAFAFAAVIVVSWLLVLATGRRIRVTRSLLPERPVAGDEPDFTVVVKNASLLPGPQLTLRSPLEGLTAGDLELDINSLAPRGERVVKTRLPRVNRGVHHLPPSLVIAEDPLGVTRSSRRAGDPLPVTVYPRIALLSSCALFPELGLKHDWAGRRGLPTPGASEFRGVRPHQPGEPLSHIDWKSTAKTGVLMLREMEEPAGADITLLLDGTKAHLVGDAADSNFEMAVRALGSMADFALRAGRGVTLLCHERARRHVVLTPDGGGRRTLLETLAAVQPTASASLGTALRRLLADESRLLRAQSVTVVSLSLDHTLVRTLIGLREEGVRLAFVYVVGPSFAGAAGAAAPLLPFLPARRGEGGDPAAAEAGGHPGAAGLPAETRALLLSLSSAGIPSLTLAHGDDLVRALSGWGRGRRSPAAAGA